MERVELLVSQLYSPTAPPEVVQSAQRGIQELQKSPDGWQLGNALLSTSDPKAQFLGAQTLLVKLNDGTGLPSWPEVQQALINCLNDIVVRQYAPFVARKLLSVVVKAYMNSVDWHDLPAYAVEKLGAYPQYVSDFLTILVEDSELDANASRAKLVPEASSVAHDYFAKVSMDSENVLHAFTAWATAFFDVFNDLIGGLVSMLANTTELAIYSSLRELYVVHWRSWLPQDKRRLSETLANMANKYSTIPPPDFADDDEFIAYMQLVIAICLEDFGQHKELHALILQVAAAPVPVVDDPLAVEALDFWNQFTEEIISSGMSSESNELIAQVISGYWPRIRLYPGLRQSDWEEFASFRKDFADFLELSYPLLGLQMFDHLTSIVLNSLSLPEVDWESIESALFCLNGLADIIGEDYRGDRPEFRSVQRIFQSNLWQALPQCNNVRVRQTAVNVIGCFVDFFLSPEGQPYLAVTLTYLFTSLGTPMLQNTASRSIQKLCDTCRTQLVNEVPAFLSVYAELNHQAQLESTPQVRTVSGIAYVIQAMPDSVDKVEALDHLITIVISAASCGENEAESQRNRLKCIATIGKSLQAPEPKPLHYSGFWTSNSVAVSVHTRLQSIIESMIATTDLEDIEIVCEILKSGMVEHEGPFVFSQSEVIGFVKAKFEIGPQTLLGPVIDMCRFFISTQLATAKLLRAPGLSSELLAGFVGVARQGGPDSRSVSLDLLTQILAACAYAQQDFLGITGSAEAISEVALPGMASTDRFVLRSAATFWSSYATKMAFQVDGLGVQLVHALLIQISGQASRSDLISVTEVLKAMLQNHQMQTMNWLKIQVVDAPDLRNIVKQEIKTRTDFLSQLALVKGNRKTGEIVQRFWLKCRGIPESYNPVK